MKRLLFLLAFVASPALGAFSTDKVGISTGTPANALHIKKANSETAIRIDSTGTDVLPSMPILDLWGENLSEAMQRKIRVFFENYASGIVARIIFKNEAGRSLVSIEADENTTNPPGLVMFSTASIRFNDANNSNYVGFKSSDAVTSDILWTLPAADGTSGQVLQTDGAKVLSWATASGGGGGNFDVTFNADQAKLPATNPAVISNSTNAVVSSLLFDASTDESVTWSTVLRPFSSGSLKVQLFYSMLSATSGTVDFEASLMCVSDGDSADIDTESFAAAVAGSATVPGTAGYLDVISITPTDDSCAAGDLAILKISRDANDGTNDTATGDAEVRKVRFYAE